MLADFGFKGARGGMAGRMIVNELAPGIAKLGRAGVDVSAYARAAPTLFGRLTAIREMGLNPDQLTKAFGKRATPSMLALFQGDRLERLPQGLGDFAGTALGERPGTREKLRQYVLQAARSAVQGSAVRYGARRHGGTWY